MDDPLSIPQTEENIPLLAALAVKLAIKDALTCGRSVTQARDGKIIERMPDGTERLIKEIDPPIQIKPGTVFRLG
jgi:hypothetical protein